MCMYVCNIHLHELFLLRMVGEGEFTDSSGHVWIGDFKGTLAEGLKLKLS